MKSYFLNIQRNRKNLINSLEITVKTVLKENYELQKINEELEKEILELKKERRELKKELKSAIDISKNNN